MTMLDERAITGATPAPPPLRDRGLLAPWRLAARLARRETRRRPGRTVLAALLIAVPVLAMTVGSVLVRTEAAGSTWSAQFAARWPGADVVIEGRIPGDVVNVDAAGEETLGPDRPAIEEQLPAGSRVVDALWVYSQVLPAGRDRDAVSLIWTDLPLDDPMVAGVVDVVDGRLPEPGEILLDTRVADDLGARVGDRLDLDRPSGEWTVSGIGRYRADHWQRIAVVPGFDRERIAEDQRAITTMIDLPAGTSVAETSAVGHDVYGLTPYQPDFDPYDRTGATLAWGWVGGVLALVAVGIIVTAAFATSARRQLVAVGQLASNGATPSVIRRSLALQGTWTAAVGVVVGMAAGLAALPFVAPIVERWILQRDMSGYTIAPWDLVAIAATALVAGTLAAGVPARSLSQVPVMAALAGRRPLGRPPRWLVPTGVVLTVGGLGLMALAGAGAGASDGDGDIFALGIVIAAVAVVFGMVCITPLVVERAGRLAVHLPLSPRLALRGMARVRTRSAAVVAAIAVAVGGSVAMAVVADDALTDNYYGDAYLPENAVVIQAYDTSGPAFDDGDGDAPVDPPMLPSLELSEAQRAAVDAGVPGARIAPLTMAGFDPPSFRWSQQTSFSVTGEGPLIATPPLMDVIGMSARDRDLLDDAGVLLLRAPGDGTVFFGDAGVFGTYEVGGETVELRPTLSQDVPRYGFGFQQLVVSEAFAEEVGFTPVTRGAIVRGDGAVDDPAVRVISDAFVTDQPVYSAFVEPGDPPRSNTGFVGAPTVGWGVSAAALLRPDDAGDLWIARAIIVGVALLISSLVVAIGLSLAAAEGRDERDTLTIVGATPATMRRQTSTRAVTMALIGIVLGIPTGFLPTWVLWGAIDGDWPPFPWVTSLLLLAAVPLAVAGAAWLASAMGQRLRPASPTRRD